MSKLYKLGVVGNPIEHSLSPFIHSRFARNENVNIEYLPYKVSEADLNCNNCGYKSNELNWKCPSCNRWETILPKSAIDIIRDGNINE